MTTRPWVLWAALLAGWSPKHSLGLFWTCNKIKLLQPLPQKTPLFCFPCSLTVYHNAPSKKELDKTHTFFHGFLFIAYKWWLCSMGKWMWIITIFYRTIKLEVPNSVTNLVSDFMDTFLWKSTEANLGCVKTSSVYSVLASSVTVEVKSSGVYSVLCSPSQ